MLRPSRMENGEEPERFIDLAMPRLAKRPRCTDRQTRSEPDAIALPPCVSFASRSRPPWIGYRDSHTFSRFPHIFASFQQESGVDVLACR